MATEPRQSSPWERHLQTIMLSIMLLVISYVGAQYAGQDKRISLTEQQQATTTQGIVAANVRMQRLEDRSDDNMREIRMLVQSIYDKIDKKADKP